MKEEAERRVAIERCDGCGRAIFRVCSTVYRVRYRGVERCFCDRCVKVDEPAEDFDRYD